MTTLEHRQAQTAYVAELFVIAFCASRGVGQWNLTTDENYRLTAVAGGARIAMTDETGNDLDAVRTTAAATLAGQDFQHFAASMFLDDLIHDSGNLAREQRQAAAQ